MIRAVPALLEAPRRYLASSALCPVVLYCTVQQSIAQCSAVQCCAWRYLTYLSYITDLTY